MPCASGPSANRVNASFARFCQYPPWMNNSVGAFAAGALRKSIRLRSRGRGIAFGNDLTWRAGSCGLGTNRLYPMWLDKGVGMEGFKHCFEGLEDPRTGNAGRHDLLEMLMIALCTVVSGGEDCTDMAEFARTKLEFLRGFLKLEYGAPSHDTFSRLFRMLDPEQFGNCFQRFMTRFAEACQGVVAIDGKVLRRSFNKASGKSALHMVSAWGCEQRLVLGQIATDAKSNEITAVPKLLKMLSLECCVVTVDALNCQREIARQVVDQKADYVLALKGNQGRCTRTCAPSLTMHRPNCRSLRARWTATTAASRHARPCSRAMFPGSRRRITGRVSPRSARLFGFARHPMQPAQRPPITC